MRALVNVTILVLVLTGGFVILGSSIPQVESRRGGAAEINLNELSVPEFVRAGKDIVQGRGNCTLCHAIGGGAAARCPDLNGIGANAATRRPGLSAEGYLVEALYDPPAYVVKGFSPIMPPAWKPPISLNDDEIRAVIAYLQSLGGKITVKPSEPSAIFAASYEARITRSRRILEAGGAQAKGDVDAGRELFFGKIRCVACHAVNGRGGVLGPDLSEIGAINTAEYLEGKIRAPASSTVKGYKTGIMPEYFAQHLTNREMEDLVGFLISLKGGAR